MGDGSQGEESARPFAQLLRYILYNNDESYIGRTQKVTPCLSEVDVTKCPFATSTASTEYTTMSRSVGTKYARVQPYRATRVQTG